MKKKHFLSLFLALLIIWVVAVTFFSNNLGSNIRWVNDYYDRFVYVERAAWFVDGGMPYIDTFSEYPQVATYFFALPYLILMPMQLVGNAAYSAIFSFLMLIALGSTILLVHKSLPKDKKLAFLLLLPAPLYFTFNRFDILPALMVLGSVLLFFQGRKLFSSIILAIGAMTKWYPALLLPPFLVYEYYRTKRINWLMIVAFLATCIGIVLPTYVFGGWSAVLVPYRMHLARGLEFVSLPALLQDRFFIPLGLSIDSQLMGYVFLVLQFFPTLFSPFVQLKKREELLNWSVVIIGLFMAFSEIYSPQWILWLMPFLILVAKTKKDILLLSVYAISTYIAFPVLFDGTGVDSVWMAVVSSFNLVLLLTLIFFSIKRLRFRWVFAKESGDISR